MADNWYTGNADTDGQRTRGWLLGHFLGEDGGVRASDAVEVKWGVHPAGEGRDAWAIVWGPGIDHCWQAEADSVVITVRWPSIPSA